MAKSKSDKDVKEIETKTKPKKTKKVETENVADVKIVENNVKVDVEIDCRSCSNSSNQCVYIRRKRSI